MNKESKLTLEKQKKGIKILENKSYIRELLIQIFEQILKKEERNSTIKFTLVLNKSFFC